MVSVIRSKLFVLDLEVEDEDVDAWMVPIIRDSEQRTSFTFCRLSDGRQAEATAKGTVPPSVREHQRP